MTTKNKRAWSETDKRYARMYEKKQYILESARRKFIENGYERTSMEALAKETGASKVTIYRQFSGKEALFITCMQEPGEETIDISKYSAPLTKEEARRQLIQLGMVAIDLITRPDIVMLYRMLIGEINRFPQLGPIFYAGGPGQVVGIVEHILSNLFTQPERSVRAQAFFWASLGDSYERAVLGIIGPEEAKAECYMQVGFAATMVLG